MSCVKCVGRIEDSLMKQTGIHNVQVSLILEKAEIEYDPVCIIPATIIETINSMGYTARLIENELTEKDGIVTVELLIEGMTCSNCVYKVEKKLKTLKGLTEASVTLITNRGLFKYEKACQLGPRDIINKINELGFKASLLNSESKSSILAKKSIKLWRDSFLISVAFGLPSMLTMIVFMYILTPMNGEHSHHGMMNEQFMIIPGLNLENFLMLLFCTPVQIFGGRHFYKQAYMSLKEGYANMDVLVALSTTISFTYSLFVLIVAILVKSSFSPTTFFDTPPMLLIFVSLGRWLEHIAKAKTSEALSKVTR